MDRKHHAATETVCHTTIFADNRQASTFQKFQLVTFPERFLAEYFITFGRVTEAEFLNRVRSKTALFEIRISDGFAFFGVVQHVLEITLCEFRDEIHAFARVGSGFLLVGLLGFLDGDVVFLGEVTDGFRISEMLVLHQECDGITAFPRRKILPDLLYRRHHKRRRALVGKRAQSFEIRARALELDKVADDFFHTRGFENGINGCLGNHDRSIGANILFSGKRLPADSLPGNETETKKKAP